MKHSMADVTLVLYEAFFLQLGVGKFNTLSSKRRDRHHVVDYYIPYANNTNHSTPLTKFLTSRSDCCSTATT